MFMKPETLPEDCRDFRGYRPEGTLREVEGPGSSCKDEDGKCVSSAREPITRKKQQPESLQRRATPLLPNRGPFALRERITIRPPSGEHKCHCNEWSME